MRRGPGLLIGLILLVPAGLFFCCSDSDDSFSEGFEVHEWGVLVGCYSDAEYYMTSRPEQASLVREPVIYIHKEDKYPFSCRVTFGDGSPTLTYPEADTSGGQVFWDTVGFADVSAFLTRGADDFVPLEEIIDILNNVDADELDYHGTYSRFLFYEGAVAFENEIEVMPYYSFDSLLVINHGDYTVHSLVLVKAMAGLAPIVAGMFRTVDSLAPDDSAVVRFPDVTEYVVPPWALELYELGFTPLEAGSFADLWSNSFLALESEHELNMIYRLSRPQYDRIAAVDFNPDPEEFIRALYVVVHMTDSLLMGKPLP